MLVGWIISLFHCWFFSQDFLTMRKKPDLFFKVRGGSKYYSSSSQVKSSQILLTQAKIINHNLPQGALEQKHGSRKYVKADVTQILQAMRD